MPKETFYFSHDHYARKDPKCIALIKEFGAAGYGTYWMLVEVMNEQGGKIKKFPALMSALSHEFNIEELALSKQIEAMLHRFELLHEDEKYLWSESVLARLQEREHKRDVRAYSGYLGGIKSGESRRLKIQAKQNEAPLQANEANEPKESKEKESKEKESKGEERALAQENLIFDIEIFLKKNRADFELICMAAHKSEKDVWPVVEKYHLWNQENDKYPRKPIQLIAGLKKWLINEKKFMNGTNFGTPSGNSKTAGLDEVRERLAEKLATRGKANSGG